MDDLPPGDAIRNAVIGVDFGGGTSAHAFCCMGFTTAGALVVLDEYHEKAALTPNKLAEAFVDFVRGERKSESRGITMKVMDILERGNKG